MTTAVAFPAKMTLAHPRALLKNLVLEVVLVLEVKAKFSIIQVPDHSRSSGSSRIYTTGTAVQTSHKKRIRDASNLLVFIQSRCPILGNFSVHLVQKWWLRGGVGGQFPRNVK